MKSEEKLDNLITQVTVFNEMLVKLDAKVDNIQTILSNLLSQNTTNQNL